MMEKDFLQKDTDFLKPNTNFTFQATPSVPSGTMANPNDPRETPSTPETINPLTGERTLATRGVSVGRQGKEDKLGIMPTPVAPVAPQLDLTSSPMKKKRSLFGSALQQLGIGG